MSMRPFVSLALLFILAWGLVTDKVAFAEEPVDRLPVVRQTLLSAGTPWETAGYEIESGVEGPVLLLTGGMHGNEPAGYRAAEQIRHWPIRRGRLIVVPQVNKLGVAANQRWLPTFREDKRLRDPNRNFPQEEEPDEAETVPCQALWQLAHRVKPTWVIDLHEGFDFHIANQKSVGSSLIYLKSSLTEPIALRVQEAVNATIEEEQRKFVLLDRNGPVKGSFVRAATERLGCQGFIFETTFKDQPLSLRVRQHRVMVSTLLQMLGMIDSDCTDRLAPAQRDDVSHVALYDGTGTGGTGVATLTKLFDEDTRFVVHHVGPRDLQTAPLDQFSLVVFPGGSGSRQANAIGAAARTRVRTYVENGGGYLGICAGAYLCSAHYDWSLDLIDTKVFTGAVDIPGVGRKQMWHRGPSATVKLELTDEERKILGDWPGEVEVRYHNGPIVSAAGNPELPTFRPLAYFRSEVSAWEPQQGTMLGTPAIVASAFGEGRVISISPHPESSGELSSIVNQAAAWLCSKGETSLIEKPKKSLPVESKSE